MIGAASENSCRAIERGWSGAAEAAGEGEGDGDGDGDGDGES
jgi:hypothetical protein